MIHSIFLAKAKYRAVRQSFPPMSRANADFDPSQARHWQHSAHSDGQVVETVELRSGARLVLSHFDAGEARVFSFTEPDDMFGFGFHLQDGALFCLDDLDFETRALDVWVCAAPRGAVSQFVLPAKGFRTVSIRFDPEVAEEYFDAGLALPARARDILKSARSRAGAARLASMEPAAAARLQSMFTTHYGGAARRLYLQSCALDLLADQIGSLLQEDCHARALQPQHRAKVVAARDYLDRHFRAPPTIPELAKIVGTNEFTLKRAFKAAFGVTLFGYVVKRRMERAELLLLQGTTVASAAEEVGYDCPRSFSAAFRRQLGKTPSAVRRATRQILPD